MRLLYSNILPVGIEEGQATIAETFVEQLADSDSVEIAVGYVSKASLEELDALVETHHIQHISLVIGIGMAVPCKGARIIFEAILKTFAGIPYEYMEANIEE